MKKGRWTERREGKNTGVGIRREKEGEGSEGSFIGVQGSFVIGAPLPRAWTGEADREAKPKRTKLRFFPSYEKPGGK